MPKNNKKENKTNIKKNLQKYASGYQIAFIVAIVLAVLGSITSIIGPDKLGEMTNLIIDGLKLGAIDLEQIGKIALYLATLYVIGAILSYAQGFIMGTISQRFSQRLRTGISDKINKVPLKYFDSHSQGDTLSRVTNDVDTVGQSLNQSLGMLFPSIALFIGSLIMMFKSNFILSITAILSVLLGFIIMMIIMSKSQKYFNGQQKNLAAVNGFIEEAYSGHNVVGVSNATEDFSKDFNKLNKSLYGSVLRAQFLSGLMQPLMAFIGNFGYVAVCVVGSVIALDGQIEFGVIVSFMIYVRLFSQPLSQLAQIGASLQPASASLKRVFEFLDEEELQDETNKQASFKDNSGDVEFKNVSFGYDPNELIIKDFSVKTTGGEKVAIVGPTGAGKTTIVNLLMKFYDVDKGSILIDETPTEEVKREAIHDQFCMVLQDTWLFEGTIKENLIYNQENISDERMIDACKAVGVDHFIRTLPKAYQTVVNDDTSISVGQKQLLTIARALIKNSPMLILDEATSSVDTRTEELIQSAMDKLMEGKTSFVIAHRLSTIKNANIILVMDKGNIIEKGNHEELMSQKGFYADLYNSQFAK